MNTWQTHEHVEQLLGPPTGRFVDDPELREAEIRLDNSGRNMMPTIGLWDRWSDPTNPGRWVAILYEGNAPLAQSTTRSKRASEQTRQKSATRLSGRTLSVLAIEGHAGEAHTLVAARVDVLIVMQELALARTQCLQKGVSRRRTTDPAGVVLLGDYVKEPRGIRRRRSAQDRLILGAASSTGSRTGIRSPNFGPM